MRRSKSGMVVFRKVGYLLVGWLLCTFGVQAQDSTFTNLIGMQFIRVAPGTITVGKFQPPYPKMSAVNASATNELAGQWTQKDYALAAKLAKQDAQPGFSVTISRPYFLSKFEVTQAQWKRVMGTNPAQFQGSNVTDDANEHPVEQVSWNDAQRFLAKLNTLDKTHHYRLPTEFEWEYAARAGATDDVPWKTIWASAQMGGIATAKVGQKQPSAWGFYDMLGNVWEWVQDVYNDKQFADPEPAKTGSQHVLKGASFVGDVKNATYMTHAGGPGNGWDVGFRVLMEIR